jgi:hypothetical protein
MSRQKKHRPPVPAPAPVVPQRSEEEIAIIQRTHRDVDEFRYHFIQTAIKYLAIGHDARDLMRVRGIKPGQRGKMTKFYEDFENEFGISPSKARRAVRFTEPKNEKLIEQKNKERKQQNLPQLTYNDIEDLLPEVRKPGGGRKRKGKSKGKDKKAEQDRLAKQAYELRQQGKSDEEIEKALSPHGTGTADYYVNLHKANMEGQPAQPSPQPVHAPTAPTTQPTAHPTVSEVKPEAGGQKPQTGEPTATTPVAVPSPSEGIPSHGNGTGAGVAVPVPASLEGLLKLVENYFAEMGSRLEIVKAKAGEMVEAQVGVFKLVLPPEEEGGK